jgi:PTH1 family peptidyl-tRNA hydrolase
MVIDELARDLQTGSWSTRCQSRVCAATIAAEQVVLAKPLTFMNASGRAVQLLLAEFPVDPKGLIVVLDDLNLPLGKIRIRERGSAGGHLGLESVVQTLCSDEIIRVRLGIGEENMPEDRADFVLSDFPPDSTAKLAEMTARAAQAVKMMITDGVSRAMSVFNA